MVVTFKGKWRIWSHRDTRWNAEGTSEIGGDRMPEEVLAKGLNRPPPDLSLIPMAERAVVFKALSPIPQNRFGGCVEFMRSLARIYGMEFVVGQEGDRAGVAMRPLRNQHCIA